MDQWLLKGDGGGMLNRQSTEDFQGSKTTLYDMTEVDMHPHTFAGAHRMHNTMSEP